MLLTLGLMGWQGKTLPTRVVGAGDVYRTAVAGEGHLVGWGQESMGAAGSEDTSACGRGLEVLFMLLILVFEDSLISRRRIRRMAAPSRR